MKKIVENRQIENFFNKQTLSSIKYKGNVGLDHLFKMVFFEGRAFRYGETWLYMTMDWVNHFYVRNISLSALFSVVRLEEEFIETHK